MKKIILLTAVVFTLSACITTQDQPLTLNMTPEQLAEAEPLALCSDSKNYVLPEVDKVIKTRKINCKKVLTSAITNIAKNSNNVDVCNVWMNTNDPMERSIFQKEQKNRKLDCGSILAAKAQQDSLEEIRRANDIAASQAIQQSIQNQQAINAMNRPRQTTCFGYSCTTY